MNASINKTEKLSGTVQVPSSKSQTIRGLIFGLLANGRSTLINPLASDDTNTAIKVLTRLGAKIEFGNNRITVKSTGKPSLSSLTGHLPQRGRSGGAVLHTGDSGITTRFILPALGLRADFNRPIVLDCGQQMRQRPIQSLVQALNDLGMDIKYQQLPGQCPLLVRGKLTGGQTQVDGTTSQYISALLMSLPLAEKDSVITVKNLHERPYVDMTLNWLNSFGINYGHSKSKNIDRYKIKGRQTYKYFRRSIPGDFSSASYFLAAGALMGQKVILKGLDMADPQGDKRLVVILKAMKAGIQVTRSSITISKAKNLRGIKIDANDIPDLVPTLAVLGTQAGGRTEISNVRQARIKETDRLHSMTQGLRAMGAKVVEKADGLIIYQSHLKGAQVQGFNDHRTVMALALAGMLASGTTTVRGAEAVNKTFPEFYRLMKKLGAKISLSK